MLGMIQKKMYRGDTLTCEHDKNRTRFSANEENPILKVRLYSLMLPWQQQIRQLNYENTEGCTVLILVSCHFLGSKGSRILEKCIW
jgi:hypothetical protein